MGDIASVIIMAGGMAKRLGYLCKPLMNVCGDRLIVKSIKVALKVCKNVVITYTEYTKELKGVCSEFNLRCIKTSGKGYSKDLAEVLRKVKLPALILPADLPFINYVVVNDFIKRALELNSPVVGLCVIDNDKCKLIGISVIKELEGSEALIPYPPSNELIDVDTLGDLVKVRKICDSMEGSGGT